MVNIINDGEKLKSFSLRSETKQGCSLSLIPFKTVLEILPREINKENKKHPTGREVELSLFSENMIFYVEYPIDFTQNC